LPRIGGRELRQLVHQKRKNRLQDLFWVQLKPCGWRHTELAQFQWIGHGSNLAVSEYTDETERENIIVLLCDEIASNIRRSLEKFEPVVSVRRLLSDSPQGRELTVERVLSDASPYSIVCLGYTGRIQAAIKVLKWMPSPQITSKLLAIGQNRCKLEEPTFVRLHEVFGIAVDEGTRVVFVSEYLGDIEKYKSDLLSTMLEESKAGYGNR
jgi:hypothetical protein